MCQLGRPIVPKHPRISMVNPLCTLGHANPTYPSNPIVHCRTDRISMVNHLCTLGHANPICPTVDHGIGWTGGICSPLMSKFAIIIPFSICNVIVHCTTIRNSIVKYLCTCMCIKLYLSILPIVHCRTGRICMA